MALTSGQGGTFKEGNIKSKLTSGQKAAFFKPGKTKLTSGRSGGFLTGSRKAGSKRVKDRM